MKTKLLAFLLALAMVFSMAMSVSAADSDTTGALELIVGNGKGTVTVDVYLQGAGITNGSITLQYDASVLTVADVKVSDAYAMNSVNTETAGTVTLTWVGSELTADKSLMLTLQLEVAEGTVKDLTYTAVSNGCFTDTAAVEVADASVTMAFDAPVDTTELEKAIAAAEAVDSSKYTQESYAVLTAALNNAMSVLTSADATQETVNAAAKAIYDAIAGLAEKTGTDTTKLEEAVKKADALDKSLYTADSYAAVEKALAEAKAVLAKVDATQAEVDSALQALSTAMNHLKKVDAGSDTGDNSHVLLWAAVMLASLAAAVAAMVAMIRNGKSKQVSRFLSLVLVSAMLLSMAPVTGFAVVKGEDGEKSFLQNLKDILDPDSMVIRGQDSTFAGTIQQVFDKMFNLKLDQDMNTSANQYAPTDVVRILIELEGDSLLAQGYTQSQITANGAQVANDTAKRE